MSAGIIISSPNMEYFHIDRKGTLYTLQIIGLRWMLDGEGLEMPLGRAGTSWVNILPRALKEIENYWGTEARRSEAEALS